MTDDIKKAADATAPEQSPTIEPDHVDEPAAAEPAPEPVATKPDPTIDPKVQAWVRRELHLLANGLSEDERASANP